MDGNHETSPILGNPLDIDDAKYVSGLSTILVATIQEAKDRISQIEYIFCSQLYPSFQSKSKSMQKIYSEAKRTSEDEWHEKEKGSILQIEKLQLEKKMVLEEKQSLILERERLIQEHEEKTKEQLAKLRSQELKIHELEREVSLRSMEVNEEIKLQKKLLELVQMKASEIMSKDKQLNQHEEKTNMLLADLNNLEKKVEMLQEELREKTQEVAKEKGLAENLREKIDMQILEIANNERLLIGYDKEKIDLTCKMEALKENISGLHEELRNKTEEMEEVTKSQETLLKQIDLTNSEMVKKKQQLLELEEERELLLAKVRVLEEKVQHREKCGVEAADERDSCQKFVEQIESKDSELKAARVKNRDLLDAYKKLKSQYNYLLRKTGLSAENPMHKLKDESDSLRHHHNQEPLHGNEDQIPDAPAAACDAKKVKDEIDFNDSFEDKKGFKSIQTSSSRSPSPGFPIVPKCLSGVKSDPVAGTKRPASGWRETRSRQCNAGPDPHDDFLDTPLENMRGNVCKVMKEEAGDPLVPVPEGIHAGSSDDETQDMNVDQMPQKQQAPLRVSEKRGFKYVESVRKKAERENLRGFECKQCKKFYDAILSSGGRNEDGSRQNFRCEHHEGVSRHRFRYNPPLTPEGFWNIGFESEM